MNKLIYGFLFLLILHSCSTDTEKKKTDNQSKVKTENTFTAKHIVSPYNGSEFTIGDTVTVKTEGGDAKIDSIIVDIDGFESAKYSVVENEFVISTAKLAVGKHYINVQSFKAGVRKQENITAFFKSDIEPKQIKATVVKKYPHSPKSYTQGLTFDEGNFYEGTGQWGESVLMKVDLETGKALETYSLPSEIFGEGIVVYKDEIIQLSWTAQKAFVFDKKTFKLKNTFTYDTQGWGITNYGDNLIMSDGSNVLYILEPNTFTVLKQIEVFDNVRAVTNLNELEYIDGKIYANVYLTNTIVVINPETGKVEGKIDLTEITPQKFRAEHDLVLNGIAYNKQNKKLYITGKRWDVLFEIKLDNQ